MYTRTLLSGCPTDYPTLPIGPLGFHWAPLTGSGGVARPGGSSRRFSPSCRGVEQGGGATECPSLVQTHLVLVYTPPKTNPWKTIFIYQLGVFRFHGIVFQGKPSNMTSLSLFSTGKSVVEGAKRRALECDAVLPSLHHATRLSGRIEHPTRSPSSGRCRAQSVTVDESEQNN